MTPNSYQRFFAELKRRRVFRVIAVYGAVAFAIIEAADAILPRLALPDWSVTLVIWVALLGLPVAIVLTWALEVTPEGFRRTADATPSELTEIITAPALKRWSAGVLALVGMTALLVGAWYAGMRSAHGPGADAAAKPVPESIAVLPFADMSPDKDQEYFSDGISEELLNLLARIPELQVTSRTSAFSFKDEDLEIPEIAERLHVAHVLEGSVRKAGDQVRINAQLIDARSDTQRWSDSWDRSLDDVFAIQDEIAADVVAQMKITLLGAAPTVVQTDPEAYALFLQARQLGRQRTADGFEQSVELYERVLETDPDYVAAWAGLAGNYVDQAGAGLRPIDEGYQLAREAANRALAIDPDYAPAHALLGQIASDYEGDLADAARHLERALALEPTNTDILGSAATLATSLGRLNEAIALLEYAVERDPVNASGRHNLGLYYLWDGRWDEAIASFRTALSLSPGSIGTQYFIGEALLLRGEPEAARKAMEQEPFEGYRLLGLALAYHDLGRPAESDAALAAVIEKYKQGAPYNIAYVQAYRGEANLAFEWLDRAVEYNDSGLSEIPTQGLFAAIRDDPRWLPFLDSIGKSPEQLAAIEFEVRLQQ